MRMLIVIILLLLLVMSVILGFAKWHFQNLVRRETEAFITVSDKQGSQIVTAQMIQSLPDTVQKWLLRSKIIGKPVIKTAHLHQTGEMRINPAGKWMPFTAEQFIATDRPGFIWMVDVKIAPGLHLAGRDKYVNGKGNMLIKMLSLLTVADSKGEKIDQGAMLRYLGEIVWTPSAALSQYIQWEKMTATTARATMSYAGITASGTFMFTETGDMKTMEAMRYYDRKEGATLELWHIEADPNGFREFDGIRIPAKCTVSWKLKAGDFPWLKVQIRDIRFNQTNFDF